MALQLKTKTRLQATGIAVTIAKHGILPQGVEAIMGQRLSPTLLLKTPGVVVVFKPALAGWHRQRIRQIPLELQIMMGLQEAVILQGNPSGTELLLDIQTLDLSPPNSADGVAG